MALQSTYQLRNSLPNRSPSSRTRHVSLAEYQPLAFDRESLESAYQAALTQPSSAAASSRSNPSTGTTSAGSTETHDPSASILSGQLKGGNNPHRANDPSSFDEPPEGGLAGVGAGHSLTPPQSPFHKQGQFHHRQALSPVAPNPPARPGPSADRGGRSGYFSSGYGGRGRNASQDFSHGLDLDDFEAAGYETDPGPVVSGQRRQLPQPPTNVPPPQLPQWEPDYKPQIPPELTQSSIQDAYARLSAPPPNLPPRRDPPRYSSNEAGPSRQTAASGSALPVDGSQPSTSRPTTQTYLSSATGISGAPSSSSGPSQEAADSVAAATSASPPARPRPEAEKEVQLRSTERTPIWSTHYLDPCLRNSMVNVPHQVSNVANIALSGLSSGPKEKYNSTIGAPIDGLAKMAKEWIVPPDGRFHSENGGIELGLGVIDSGMKGWGADKGRKRARVEVVSKRGGIKVDVLEISSNRQLDIKIETKAGDVLVLLPENFHGPIHVNSPAGRPTFLGILEPQLLPVNNPYNTFYTTFVVPLPIRHDPKKSRSIEHKTTGGIEQYVPEGLRGQSDILDQVQGGYASHTRGEQSKVYVTSNKGKVVIGYRECKDEADAKNLELKVGAQNGSQKKRWWRS